LTKISANNAARLRELRVVKGSEDAYFTIPSMQLSKSKFYIFTRLAPEEASGLCWWR